MFELNGDQYTLQALQDFAANKNVDFDTFMSDMKGKGLTEKADVIKPEKPSKASTMLSNLGLGFVEFAQGIERQKEAIQLGVVELLSDPMNIPKVIAGLETEGFDVAEKRGARAAIKFINLGSSDSYEPIVEKLEQNIPQYETQSITEDIQKGNYAQAGFRTVNAALRSAPSLVAAASGVGGLVALAGSVAGNKFEEEFEADPTKSTGLLLANAGLTGATEATFELVTRGLLKKAGFLRGQGNIKAAKELLQGGAKNIIKNIAYGVSAEGASEAATELTVALEDRLTLGKKIDKDLLYRLGDAFIVGSFIGGGISTVGELGNTNKLAKQRAETILMPEDIKQDINTKVNQLNELVKDLPNASEEGKVIIEDQINALEQDIISQKQKSSRIVNSLKDKDLQNYFNNVNEINKQKNIIKKANTKSETKLAKNKIKELIENNNSIIQEVATKQTTQVTETVKQQIKESGLDGKVTELTSEEISNIKQEGFDSKEASQQFGFIDQKTDGSFEIFLNKDKPMIGTAGHEFLHAVLFKTIKNNRTTQDALGDALIEHISKLGGDKTVLGQRLSGYGKFNKEGVFERDSNFGEETMTIMSEEILNGNLKFEESFFTKIGDIIRRFSQDYLGRQVILNKPKDVYNFVKDYTKSIKDGKISPAILKVAKEGAVGKLVSKETKAKDAVQMSKDASDNVQRIYEEKGATGAFEIIEQFKPIVSKIVEKRREAPNFDRELLMSEIEIGKRGILDLISEYKPESGVPLAAFINKFLPARAIEASQRVLGEEFTQDVTEAKGVATEEVATEVETKPKKSKIVLAKRLGVSKESVDAIKKILPSLDTSNLTFKTLKNQVPEIVGSLFGISPKKIVNKANITKGELLSSQMFINKNADLLMAMLPEGATPGGTATGVPKTLLDAFYTKTNRAKAATTGSKAGLAVQRKNKIDRTEFLETFGIIEGKPVRTDRNTSARVLALADQLGKMITNQTVREELEKQQIPTDKIAEGKSEIMFSRQAKAGVVAEKVKNYLSKNYFKNIIKEGRFKGHAIPKYKVLLERTKNGEVVMETVDMKQMQALVPGMSITYEKLFANKINKFISAYPQYYDLVREYFTGGIKRSAFISNDYFENLIPVSLKKGINQVNAKRLNYTSRKRQNKNIAKLDLSIDKNKIDNLIKFTKDIESYLKDNPNDADLFVELKKHGSIDQNNFGRKSGPQIGHAVDKNKKPIFDKDVVEEHTPQNEMMSILFGAAIDGNVDQVTPLIRAVFSQISLLKKDDPGGKLKESMGKDFYEKVAPRILSKELDPRLMQSYAGIYRLMKAGVDPNNYMLNRMKKTIAEYLNVDNLSVEDAISSIIDLFEGNTNLERLFSFSKVPIKKDIKQTKTLSKAINKARAFKQPKGISILDFDDTLATSKSLVKYTTPDGGKGTLTPEEYASSYEDMQDLGITFDFSEFNKVVKGKVAPLFQKALKLQGKFGPENMFVLTARPQQSQSAIFEFLKANGLNIPLKNITGLGNSTAEAKALWVADKVGEGYNDFYFADDALQNVQAVDNILEQFDVKRKVQQAKIQFSKDLNSNFNNILQDITGIDAVKRFDFIKARKRGASRGKFRFFIPPSHEDFVGLLYNFMGKGRKGDAHRDFLEQALVRPLNRANKEYDTARQSVATDYKSLNKQMPDVKKMFTKKTPDGDFIYQDAIRVYLWDKHGYDIPGLSPIDQKNLVDLVNSDPKLQAYAEAINTISKQETYVNPTDGWDSGDIRMDLDDATGRIGRAQFFEEFSENADIIFSKENLNKIEAGYGKNVREALEDILYRIKTGRNKPTGQNRMVNSLMNWVNGSVGSVMFFNMRSALLQQMSLVNYINFADNNIFAAAKAFANQPQYWSDWSFIFNSDMLKQRRGGIMTDVNGAELAAEMRKSKSPHRFLISKLLELGFLPTQIGDNIAIATGGATYYRNRINTYLKQGLSQKEAEAKAFTDFQDITQSTQQSARPDMVSQQQASLIGKIILNFQNVTSQFNRLGKKAFLDIKNRRITKPNSTQMQSDISNAARITYYFAVQNAIFYTLQTALFAMMFDDDEEDVNNLFLKKQERLINGSIDSVLRGTGITGAVISTLKNTAIAFARQRDVNYNPDESAVIVEAFNFSPVLGIKARKIVNAEKTLNYNKKVIKEMETFDIDNPQWSAVTNYVEGFTNAPLNRLYNKTQNVRQGFNNEHAAWERTLMFLGWSQYNLNLENTKIESVKDKIKADKKKAKAKSKAKKKSYKIIYE